MGDGIYNRQTDYIFFKLFQAADKRAILFTNGQEQHLCLRIGFLLDVTNAEKYHFNAIWIFELFAKGFFVQPRGIIKNIGRASISRTT